MFSALKSRQQTGLTREGGRDYWDTDSPDFFTHGIHLYLSNIHS